MPTTTTLVASQADFHAGVFLEARRVGRAFSVARGELLQQPYSTNSLLLLIESGAAQAYLDSEQQRQTLRLGYPGEMLAALPGFLLNKTSGIGIEALYGLYSYAYSSRQLLAGRSCKDDRVYTHARRLCMWPPGA